MKKTLLKIKQTLVGLMVETCECNGCKQSRELIADISKALVEITSDDVIELRMMLTEVERVSLPSPNHDQARRIELLKKLIQSLA